MKVIVRYKVDESTSLSSRNDQSRVPINVVHNALNLKWVANMSTTIDVHSVASQHGSHIGAIFEMFIASAARGIIDEAHHICNVCGWSSKQCLQCFSKSRTPSISFVSSDGLHQDMKSGRSSCQTLPHGDAATKTSPNWRRRSSFVVQDYHRQPTKDQQDISLPRCCLYSPPFPKPWAKLVVHLTFDRRNPSHVTLKSLYIFKAVLIDDQPRATPSISNVPLTFASSSPFLSWTPTWPRSQHGLKLVDIKFLR